MPTYLRTLDGEQKVEGIVCPLCGSMLVHDGTYVWCTHYSTQLFHRRKANDKSCYYGVVDLVRLDSLQEAIPCTS